ncbi:unannotated protein [freshwater metagenome]|uniref:Unannotated protein n=1 Tax=freshwater metagenome TaxID=449393 RepID=A0A6J6YGL3_9ZZZZ
MPTVNPSTTESGTLFIKPPNRITDIRITTKPAITPKIGIAVGPKLAITGIKTTVIAPVGPLI